MYLKPILAAATITLAGTAAQAQPDAQAQQARLDDRAMFGSGQDAFEKTCARCHTGVESQVGPDLLSGDYDPDIIRFFVRNGFGPMPAFTESMIDNATLDALADYIVQGSEGDSQ